MASLASLRTYRFAQVLLLGCVLGSALLAVACSQVVYSDAAPAGIVIHHFDVGQADATLIQAPGATVLIDTGHWQRNDVVPHLRNAGVQHIDLIILTHPHADHIGQTPAVLDAFPVTEVWVTGWEHGSQIFERVLDAIIQSGAGYHEPRAGETLALGALTVEVIHPVEPLNDIHDNLAVRIVFGEFAAVYTGDAEVAHESEMIARGHRLRADVLQLGHHGSRTSTSREFLEAVQPKAAVYSAGRDNSYGHPHVEVVNRIQGMGIPIYGTDTHGTVIVESDGRRVEVRTERRAEPRWPDAIQCVDINRASEKELERIIHIGPSRAKRIAELRPFTRVEDLVRVSGIGPALLADIIEEGLACVK